MNDDDLQFSDDADGRDGAVPLPGWWPQDGAPRTAPAVEAVGRAGADPDADTDTDTDTDVDPRVDAAAVGTVRPAGAVVARWIVAAVAGVAVAVLAVLGIDAVASAATSSASRASVFGPFGNAPSRQPPFLAGNQPGGRPAGGQRSVQPPPPPPPATTAGTVEGAITSIDGDRLELTTSSGRAIVELTATTAIADGTTVLHADQLRAGERIRAAGAPGTGALIARTVEVVH